MHEAPSHPLSPSKPWYKQFWPWFLMAIPITSVTYSLSAVYLFAQNSVHLVEEDYYKKGKAINLDRGKLNLAKALNISATLETAKNRLRLDNGQLKNHPALRVKFVHPTLPKYDQLFVLSSDANGVYRFSNALNLSNAVEWYVKIEPVVGDWALQGNLLTESSELRL